METMFDFLSVMLFIATAGIFFYRFRRENPPLGPYVLLCFICAVANWFGNNDGALIATVMLTTASFFLLQIAGEPYGDDADDIIG